MKDSILMAENSSIHEELIEEILFNIKTFIICSVGLWALWLWGFYLILVKHRGSIPNYPHFPYNSILTYTAADIA